MRIAVLEAGYLRSFALKPLAIPRQRVLVALGLTAVAVLAAALRFSNLSALGYANHYYTAAVTAMLQSWHNFFFAVAEPGGSVSVDKPPVGLWLQVISAFFLGVNTLGILLPQLVAGVLSVLVLFHLVSRSSGPVAGLVAGLALAVTPIVVATDRNNTMDSTLILTLLLAAWAFIKATESGRLRHLLLAVTLVGIGFNIKMLAAFLPLPAFYALYVFGGRERLLAKLGKLVVASALLLVVSLSWATIVDLTPADQRPYVGSSSDNSELSLITGYNGMQRLLGMGGGNGGSLSTTINSIIARLKGSGSAGGRGAAPNGAFNQPNGANDGRGFGAGDGGFTGGGGAAGGAFAGSQQTGLLRLFRPPLGKEVSWLLPFALISALLVVLRARPRWPVAPRHQVFLLWGGWLLTTLVFFSVAGFWHEYYLSIMGAPLAAMVGVGVAELWGVWKQRWLLALIVLAGAAEVTLMLQVTTAQAYLTMIWWLPFVAGVFVAGAALLVIARSQRQRVAAAGFACIVAAMLITPGIWSMETTKNSSANQSLPAAYSGRQSGPANGGGTQVNQTLLDYLQARTQGMTYLMAVPSSMQGADYVLATGRGVLYLGGFNGNDRVETSASLAKLVADKELRFVYWDGQNGGRGGFGGQPQSDVTSWVSKSCSIVQGFDTATQNAGAPDGTTGGAMARSFGNMTVTLYDCGG